MKRTTVLTYFKALFLISLLTVFSAGAHLPGPDYIYECPKCGNLMKRGSNLSGNTIGAIVYSDGKMIAPMLPSFPNLTKCNECDTILMLSDLEQVKEVKEKNRFIKEVEFLGIQDLQRALWSDAAKDKGKEAAIRCELWWAYNDRLRDGKELFEDFDEVSRWEQNCERLITLLDEDDIAQKIIKAELYRNLGDFDTCMKLISEIDQNSEFAEIKESFKRECEKMNRLVFRLQ